MSDSLILTYDNNSKDAPTLVIARQERNRVKILNVLHDNQAIGMYYYLTGSATLIEKEGKWILNEDGSGTCDQCGKTFKNVWDYDNWQNYCGHCGAKMSI